MFKYYKYDVTFSFAEEDRPFVDRVVAALKEKKIRVFYDDDERLISWGKDLARYLDSVYREEAQFCVIFISAHYKKKRWTRYERERAQARAYFAANEEYILPFRLDDAELEGLSDTVAYLSAQTYDERRLANAIYGKVERNKSIFSGLLRQLNDLFSSQRVKWTTATTAVLGLTYFSLADKFTPPNILAEHLHEHSGHQVHQAICRDGRPSPSLGSGTCSYHGGIDHYIDTFIYDKTIEQCREEARRTSWLSD